AALGFRAPPVPPASPLCSSTHAAACWSSSTFAGQRPWVVSPPLLDPFSPSPRTPVDASDLLMMSGLAPLPILHASTLIAPVPCARTFLATVFSARGLRARTIGSNAGLSAVPQPSHCSASGVAGAVCSVYL